VAKKPFRRAKYLEFQAQIAARPGKEAGTKTEESDALPKDVFQFRFLKAKRAFVTNDADPVTGLVIPEAHNEKSLKIVDGEEVNQPVNERKWEVLSQLLFRLESAVASMGQGLQGLPKGTRVEYEIEFGPSNSMHKKYMKIVFALEAFVGKRREEILISQAQAPNVSGSGENKSAKPASLADSKVERAFSRRGSDVARQQL